MITLNELKSHIKEKRLDGLYIFTGEELGIMDIYINKIAEASGKKLTRAWDFQSIYGRLRSNSLLDNGCCYVIRDDKDFISNEKLWSMDFGKNILIVILTSMDKRSKFYKQMSAKIVEFPRLNANILVKHIQAKIPLQNAYCEMLCELCENDYSRIMLEVDKIARYDSDCNKSFKALMETGAFFIPPRDAIFMLVDAITSRNSKDAFELYQECVDAGESNLAIISVLANNIKQILQVATCGDNAEKSTGLTSWQISNARKKMNKFSIGELEDIMLLLGKVERGIKNGRMEMEMSVPYVLVNIL